MKNLNTVAPLLRARHGDTGQHPKLAAPRKHKPAEHPLRDEKGVYTLVGARHPFGGARRKWVAGISAREAN